LAKEVILSGENMALSSNSIINFINSKDAVEAVMKPAELMCRGEL